MKITLDQIQDVEENTSFQKFKSRKRKLSGKQDVKDLISEDGPEGGFTKTDLESLRGDGTLDELVRIIKTGKEATVYLGKSTTGYSAVKIYTDLRVRSFRKDQIYRQGRFIGDARIEKAIDQGSKMGLDAHQLIWVGEEFRQLNYLYKIGIPVPKPIALSGLVIVMEFIGYEDDAAPRLSDLLLEEQEAKDAFYQSLKILQSIVSHGRVHGDFSTYNILWHEGKAVLIDFPQVIQIGSNTSAREILKKDVDSFCKSFKRHKVNSDPEKIYRDLIRIAREAFFDMNFWKDVFSSTS